MPTLVIVLDSERLQNPVADIRYALPDLIASLSNGLLKDDGYDYGERTNRMFVFMHTDNPDEAAKVAQEILGKNTILENDNLLGSAVLAISDHDHDNNAENYRVVYPPGAQQLSFD